MRWSDGVNGKMGMDLYSWIDEGFRAHSYVDLVDDQFIIAGKKT